MNPQVKCIIGHRRTRGFGGSRSILAPTDHLAIGSKAVTWSTPGPVWVASAEGLASDSGDDNKKRVGDQSPHRPTSDRETRDLLLTDSMECRTDRGVP